MRNRLDLRLSKDGRYRHVLRTARGLTYVCVTPFDTPGDAAEAARDALGDIARAEIYDANGKWVS